VRLKMEIKNENNGIDLTFVFFIILIILTINGGSDGSRDLIDVTIDYIGSKVGK
jgi:hypothetical protein